MTVSIQDDDVGSRIPILREIKEVNFCKLAEYVLDGVKVNIFTDEGKPQILIIQSILNIYNGPSECIRLICRIAADLIYLADYLLKESNPKRIALWLIPICENLEPNASRIFNAYARVILGRGKFKYHEINLALMQFGYPPLPFTTDPFLEKIDLKDDEEIFFVLDVMENTIQTYLPTKLKDYQLWSVDYNEFAVFKDFAQAPII